MAVNRETMSQWAAATRRQQWHEADRLWKLLMAQWLMPPVVDQEYWNALIRRRMAALERKEQRSAISDDEWDHTHQDMNR
jgi:hypothetical protein